MDFGLSEVETLLIESAQALVERALRPLQRAHEKSGSPSEELLRSWSELGLAMLAEPSDELEVSGPGRIRALQALAAGDPAATLALWQPALAAAAARQLGLPPDFPPPGALLLVGARDEVSWPRPCLPLSGADHLLVLDRAGGWGLARVEGEPVRSLGLQAAGPCSVALGEWLVQGEAEASLAATVRAGIRLSAAALLVGTARASRDYVAGYLPERVAFGKPLSQHQGLAFLFAELAMAVDGADLLLCRAAWALDGGDPEPSVDAWLEAREVALRATNLGVQLLGGHGYMDDHPVEKWMRDARGLALLFGGQDEALVEAAASVEL